MDRMGKANDEALNGMHRIDRMGKNKETKEAGRMAALPARGRQPSRPQALRSIRPAGAALPTPSCYFSAVSKRPMQFPSGSTPTANQPMSPTAVLPTAIWPPSFLIFSEYSSTDSTRM